MTGYLNPKWKVKDLVLNVTGKAYVTINKNPGIHIKISQWASVTIVSKPSHRVIKLTRVIKQLTCKAISDLQME